MKANEIGRQSALGNSSTRFPRLVYGSLLLLLYAIAASQAVASFAYKWTTIVAHPEYSLEKILNGAWPKPYAFRLLMRNVVEWTANKMPDVLAIPLIERSRQALDATQGASYAVQMSDHLALAYAIILMGAFVFLLISLFLLRRISRIVFPVTMVSRVVLDAAPIVFALLLTISYRANNGYIYDHFELFILLLYLLLVLTGQQVLTLPVLALAILNKETAVFFPLFGAVVRWGLESRLRSADYRAAAREFAVVLIGFVAIRIILKDHPGGATEFHFFTNIDFWFSLKPWLAVTAPHFGLLPLPKPTNVVVLGTLLIAIFGYWREKPDCVRWPLLVTAGINLPLFILFCWQDEYRNLSLTFPFLYLAAVHTWIRYFSDERNLQ